MLTSRLWNILTLGSVAMKTFSDSRIFPANRFRPNAEALEDRTVPTLIDLSPVADNTLFEHPAGLLSNGAGQHFFVGKTLQASNSLRRGAIKFDITAIPAGANIVSAKLTLHMSLTIAGLYPVELHRALQNWGEGNSVAGSGGFAEGTGTQPMTNDVTWLHRFFNSQNWTAAGGDFAAAPSATTMVEDVGSYEWTGSGLTADVQQWVNNAAGNFGWILTSDETVAPTAKQFDTKENATPAFRPVLSIEYTSTTTPPTISSINSTSANGSYSTGQSINVSLQFSEPVTLAGGSLQVALDSGGTVTVTPFSGAVASGSYTVLAGETSPDLNVTGLTLTGGATLTNVGGTNANLALPAANLATNAAIIVNPLPPTTVNSIGVNLGASQRSRLTRISLNFSSPVNATLLTNPEIVRLVRTAATPSGTVGTVVQTGAVGPNGRITVSPASGLVSSVTLTFDNANSTPISAGVESGSLADGRWQLLIPYLSYSSASADPTLRRIFGDSNNDGTVDGTDLAVLGVAFGQTIPDNPFDHNADGTVDGTDFAQFGTRFGLTL